MYNIAKDHVAYKYADNEVPNKGFKTLDQFRNFVKPTIQQRIHKLGVFSNNVISHALDL